MDVQKITESARLVMGSYIAVAEALGVDKSAITKWSKGVAVPTYAHFTRLCQIIGMSEAESLAAWGAHSKARELKQYVVIKKG